jgi:Coatamer beta C-terminal region.
MLAYRALERLVEVYNTGDVIFVVHITKLCLHNSGDTLQNCTLELATLGDLKLVEKPQPVVLAPRDFCNIKANVKVASTENGIIFGNIGECVFNISEYYWLFC